MRWAGYNGLLEDKNVTLILDVGYQDYEYDLVGLFKILTEPDPLAHFYMGTTSGCSCTCPWEEIENLDDLTEVRSLKDVEDYLRSNKGYGVKTGDVLDMIAAAKEIFGGR